MITAKPSTSFLEVKNLKKYFPIQQGFFKKVVGQVKAVDNISFTLQKGETLALVGESGCGKSTTGRTLLRLLEPTSGEVYYHGNNIFHFSKKEMKNLRTELQIIFQDPYSSLNPRFTIGEAVGEALREHGLYRGKALEEKVKEVLELTGINPNYINRFPNEFSGGQRQRIGIARALALSPSFIVADEAVSALDVSVQAQIINLLMDLQEKLHLSYLFISHDLGVVKHISNRVGVMYLGSIVEISDTKDLFNAPLHPYTQALLSAIPVANPRLKKSRILLRGDVPSASNPPKGCKFHTRCHYIKDICKIRIPELKKVSTNHYVACHLVKN